MSLDPNTLKQGDRIKFDECVVGGISFMHVWLSNGMRLTMDDRLWKNAELVEPYLPSYLCLSTLGGDSKSYVLKDYRDRISPSCLLSKLRQDVAALEAAGVKETEE
jgi:hypothetical protein